MDKTIQNKRGLEVVNSLLQIRKQVQKNFFVTDVFLDQV